jgi:ABC-type spermidine/putrescine transport system permease subunit II
MTLALVSFLLFIVTPLVMFAAVSFTPQPQVLRVTREEERYASSDLS